MKKHLLIAIVFTLSAVSLFAQAPNRANRGGGGKQDDDDQGAQEMGFSVVKGSLRDAVTKEPIEFAAVSLIKTHDSTAQAGMITGANGRFRFEKLPVGNYIIIVSFVGYKKYRGQEFVIKNSTYKVDLGMINIQPASTKLGEVEIVAEQATLEIHSDKKVFNVDKNLTTVSGSAADVLKNVPSVTVDQDGNVSLRGKTNVTILIDNKPSTLGTDLPTVLQQIPANTIENIEIITNPSARYSAEGTAGIINIVLKKNKLQGYNGVLIGGLGTNSPVNTISRYNATGTFNFRTEKWNISTTYSFRDDRRYSWGSNITEVAESGRRASRITDSSKTVTLMNFGRLGAEYNINAFNTLGAYVSGFYMLNPINLNSRTYGSDYNTAANPEFYASNRTLKPLDGGDNYLRSVAPGLTYRRVFVDPKHTLDLDASASDFRRYTNTAATDNYLIPTPPQNYPYRNEINSSAAHLKMYNVQLDYSNPIIKDYTLDAGYKYNSFDLDINNEIMDQYPGAAYARDNRRSSVSNVFTSENDGYVTLSGKKGHFDYQAGLRGEYAQKGIAIRKSDLSGDSINFSKTYPDLFPSAFLTYTMKENRSIGLNYSRRVERPGFQEIIPVTDYSVPTQPRRGNPDLQPEYTHSMEVNFSKAWTYNSLNLTVYDYLTTNEINVFRQQLGGDTVLTTYQNTKQTNDIGFEGILKTRIYKWWDITTSTNLYRNGLNGTNLGLGTKYSYQGDAHVVSAFHPQWRGFYKGTTMQFTMLYQSKQTLIQSSINQIFTCDFGLKKEWGKAREFALSLSVNDIFNQRRYLIYSQSGFYNLVTDRRFDSRSISLTFTYRYGKLDASFFKKKKNQDNGGGGQDMMGGGM